VIAKIKVYKYMHFTQGSNPDARAAVPFKESKLLYPACFTAEARARERQFVVVERVVTTL